MDKSEIVQQLIDYYTRGNKRQFAKMLGIAPQTVSSWLTRNTYDADILAEKCVQINKTWLYTGEGEMLQSVTPEMSANSEIKALISDMKEIYNKIHSDLEEERALHIRNMELLQRALDIYEKKLDIESAEMEVKKAM